jgi:SAM-dependent methyltransferase
VDLSERMIELARAEEAREPLGIEYRAGDARDLDGAGTFDLVAAAYLFNYARNGEEMTAMAAAARRALKPGGRLVAINNDQRQPVEAFGSTWKYGLKKSAGGPLRDGTPITYTLDGREGPFQFDNFYLSTATQEEAFRRAGFGPVRWHDPRLSPAGLREFEPGYWDDFLRHPPVVFFECEPV